MGHEAEWVQLMCLLAKERDNYFRDYIFPVLQAKW
jgi:hypothetical protein